MAIDKIEDSKRKKMWELDWSDSEIAFACGVSRTTIHSWRTKNKLENKRKGKGNHLNATEEELRIKLFNEGYSDSEIAIRVGISTQSLIQWRLNKGLSKDKTLVHKNNELSTEEKHFLNYLKNKYPDEKETHLLSLTKFIKPKVGITTTAKQKKFISRIKISGFTTVYYFDNGEYTCAEDAMRLFIDLNSKTSKDIIKIKYNMNREQLSLFNKLI